MNSKDKSQNKSLSRAWGVEVGELVFSPSEYTTRVVVRLGKVLSISDLRHKMVCDVFWFGEVPEYEKNIPLSHVSCVDSLKKFKAKYSLKEAPRSEK